MHFEVVDIVGEALDANELHPLLDPPRQTRPLVGAEIEATRTLQVIEESRKRRESSPGGTVVMIFFYTVSYGPETA